MLKACANGSSGDASSPEGGCAAPGACLQLHQMVCLQKFGDGGVAATPKRRGVASTLMPNLPRGNNNEGGSLQPLIRLSRRSVDGPAFAAVRRIPLEAMIAGWFSSMSFNCRSFSSRTNIIRSTINRSDKNRSDSSRNGMGGATAAGLTATGSPAAGVTAIGAATGVVATGSVCGVTAFAGTVSVTVVADVTGCFTTAWANVFVAGSDRVGRSSGRFSICSKATRAAAWAAVSAARTEIKPAPKTTHKPQAILIFMELSIFTPICEHPQGQISRILGGRIPQCGRGPNF